MFRIRVTGQGDLAPTYHAAVAAVRASINRATTRPASRRRALRVSAVAIARNAYNPFAPTPTAVGLRRSAISAAVRNRGTTGGVNVEFVGGKVRLLADYVSRKIGTPGKRQGILITQAQVKF